MLFCINLAQLTVISPFLWQVKRGGMVWHALSMEHTVLPVTQAFIYERNEPYVPLLSEPKLVLIYQVRQQQVLT